MVSNGMCMAIDASVVYSSLIHMLHAPRIVFPVSLGPFEIMAELFRPLPILAAGFDVLTGGFKIPIS